MSREPKIDFGPRGVIDPVRAFAGLEKTPGRLNDAEVVLILVIPFVAALMARGAWLF